MIRGFLNNKSLFNQFSRESFIVPVYLYALKTEMPILTKKSGGNNNQGNESYYLFHINQWLFLKIIRINAFYLINLLHAHSHAIFNHIIAKLTTVYQNNLHIGFRLKCPSLRREP